MTNTIRGLKHKVPLYYDSIKTKKNHKFMLLGHFQALPNEDDLFNQDNSKIKCFYDYKTISNMLAKRIKTK